MSERSSQNKQIRDAYLQRKHNIELEQLKKLIRTCCQTIFVGAVAKAENYFGDLWGESNDLDEEDMSLEQQSWYNKFLDMRDEIFDQGNDQYYKIIKALSLYLDRNRTP